MALPVYRHMSTKNKSRARESSVNIISKHTKYNTDGTHPAEQPSLRAIMPNHTYAYSWIYNICHVVWRSLKSFSEKLKWCHQQRSRRSRAWFLLYTYIHSNQKLNLYTPNGERDHTMRSLAPLRIGGGVRGAGRTQVIWWVQRQSLRPCVGWRR